MSFALAMDAVNNPTLHRIVAHASSPHFELGAHYRIVARERGAVRRDIPVFAMAEELTFPSEACVAPRRTSSAHTVDGLPGAVLIREVLSPEECDWIVKLTETAGYDEDAPTRLGRHVRQNENCVLVASEALNELIFERCRSALPQISAGGELRGINRRWRFYKYHPGDIFKAHIDPGGWTGSGFDASGQLLGDSFGDRWSMMTFLVYLNDDFVGGDTRFFLDPVNPSLGDAGQCRAVASVSPERGSVLCFFHGHDHPLSPWHEGGQLTAGTKYVLRTDVLYKFR